MSYFVALQSAAFYILACTPCTGARQRSKARAKAKREKHEKERMEAENPGMYHQPSPFHTSPHWQEEIMMGPSLPKKNSRTTSSQRRLTTASSSSGAAVSAISSPPSSGNASMAAVCNSSVTVANTPTPISIVTIPTATPVTRTTRPRTATAGSTSTSTSPHPGSSSTMVIIPDDTTSQSGESSWNFKRYQREDEELWGQWGPASPHNHHPLHHVDVSRAGHKLMDALAKAGSSAGRLLDSTLGKERSDRDRSSDVREVTNEDRRRFYSSSSGPRYSNDSYSSNNFVVKNPPVNDYHPPVVSSNPANRDGRRWMLQPPPPVKVMEAKVPVGRSRSSASNFSATGGTDRLGKVVGERLMGAKMGRTTRGSSRDGDAFPSAATTTPTPRQPAPTAAAADTMPRRSTASSLRSKRSQHRRRSRSLSTKADSGNDSSTEEGNRVAGGSPRTSPRKSTMTKRRVQPPAVTPEVESELENSDYTTLPPSKQMANTVVANAERTAPTATTVGLSAQGHAVQRPRLETILGSKASSPALTRPPEKTVPQIPA